MNSNNNIKKNLDFIVIGAQKCATSWMYYCLQDHPEILLPNDKIEHAYYGSELFQRQGEEWYFSRFTEKKGSRFQGEVAVDYIYDTQAAKYLYDKDQNPKIIASIRNPVDRLISSYYWLIRKNKLPNIPIDKGIEEILDQSIGFHNKIDGPLEEIVRRGCYGPQLESYLQYFDKQQILVFLYENIKTDSPTAIKRMYEFLEVDSNFVPKSLNSRPKQNSYNSTLIKLERAVDRKYLLGRIIARVSNKINQYLTPKNSLTDHQLDPKYRKKLFELFQPQIQHTVEVINRIDGGSSSIGNQIIKSWKV